MRLPNGNTLATYQFKGQPDVAAGALVELDPVGKLVRASDASDATDSFIRPYSLVAVPALDRVVTTSAPMMATDKASHVIQVWRLSDLKLIKSIVCLGRRASRTRWRRTLRSRDCSKTERLCSW